MSRTSQGLKNVTITLIFYVLSMFLSFFSRKIFIDSFGADLMGLSTTIINMLGFLNLAELGVTSAIATALYKPLYFNDRSSINDIISIFNYLYHIIGIVILVLGIGLLFFIPVFFDKVQGVNIIEIYITYVVFFCTLLVSYFISYKQLLLTADQRDYVIVSLTKTCNILKIICQIIVIKFFALGYMAWLALEVIGGIGYGLLINRKVRKSYPWLNDSFETGRKVCGNYREIFKKIRQIIPHRLAGFVLAQTDNIVLFAVTSSLALVTSYNNYIILIGSAVMVLTVSSNGVYASVGNLVAQGDSKAIKKLFDELFALYYFLGGILVIALSLLAEPFIKLWLGEEFVLDPLVFYFILFNTSVAIFRLPVELFLNGYMLYKDVWAPVSEAIINLSVSIVLGIKMGLLGVVLGTTLSLVTIVCIWRPIFLYKEGFKASVYPFFLKAFVYIGCIFCTFYISWLIKQSFIIVENSNYLSFIHNTIILLIVIIVIQGILMYCVSSGMRNFLVRLLRIVKIVK